MSHCVTRCLKSANNSFILLLLFFLLRVNAKVLSVSLELLLLLPRSLISLVSFFYSGLTVYTQAEILIFTEHARLVTGNVYSRSIKNSLFRETFLAHSNLSTSYTLLRRCIPFLLTTCQYLIYYICYLFSYLFSISFYKSHENRVFLNILNYYE